jgi:arginyl-tRNA synthetase
MKDIIKEIEKTAAEAIQEMYQVSIAPADILVSPTKKEHTGDYTLVTFPLAKSIGLPPQQIAAGLADYFQKTKQWVSGIEIVQGFLNISLATDYWNSLLVHMQANPDFWKPSQTREIVLVEFSSPNTNKPLHLGHIRNILLGWSTSKILTACGYSVKRVQIVNDRGIAICKSMLAWQQFGEGATPEQAGMKSDHFVGEWYVRFEKEFKAEYGDWQSGDDARMIFRKLKNLDNMSLSMLREAVALARGRALLEASGGITPETARTVAETGVDMISLGWLTHSVHNLDVALEIEPDPV